MNSFKNPLGVSLGLLLVAVVAYFYTVEAPKLTTVTTKKEVAVRATAINYEGAMVVSEVDDIDDILAELEANPPAGGATFDMETMARSITAEALKAFSDSKERALPLTAHWNVGESEGMDPMYMLSRIELGEHILVSWKLDPYYSDTIGSSYYEESVKKAAELNLPLVFVLPAPESALTKENYYRSLEATENPNVVDTNGDIVEKLSPFGPDELWSEMGEQWASTALMAQLQEWYPNPPLVVFVSKDEADKLLWSELETSSRYQENYPAGKDDSFKRTLVGAKWIEKYRQMHDGFKKGFTQTPWKENVKFVSYNKLSDNLGTSNEWINNATLTNQYMNVWPLTADGVTIDFNLLGDKSDTSTNAPHILANNLPFMLSEAKLQNPSFSYQLSIDDNEKITDVARYRGLTQFALWFLRPSTIRQASSATTAEELEPMYQELSDSVELIHYNEQLASFWRDAELVSTGESDLNKNIPSQYQYDPRKFLLETDANPIKPWDENTAIKVWSFALLKGESPNREWLVYVQSPEGNISDLTVTIPTYQDIKVDSSVNGQFYILSDDSLIRNIPNENITSFALHTSKQIEELKLTVEDKIGIQYDAYVNFINLADKALTKNAHPIRTLKSYQYYTATQEQLKQMNLEQSYLANDSNYAYQLALAYQITSNDKYALKAIEIINAWALINKGYVGVGFDGDSTSDWKTKNYYNQTNADLNMASSGASFIQAAILLKNYAKWSQNDKDSFTKWCDEIYRKNTDKFIGSEERKNEWLIGNVGATARLGILLVHVWENDKDAIVNEDVRVLKEMLDLQIETLSDSGYNIPAMLPVEVRRGDNGIWYTAWALSSLTTSMQIIANEVGIDLFKWKNKNNFTIEDALNQFFLYVKNPEQWPWLDGKGNTNTGITESGKIVHRHTWGGNLYEAMSWKYQKPQWREWSSSNEPTTYFTTQFNWNVPSLLPVENTLE